MNEHDYRVVEAMEKYGGSFIQQLAKLARHADPNNLIKIKSAWSDYWRQYEKFARKDISIHACGECGECSKILHQCQKCGCGVCKKCLDHLNKC